LLPLNDGQPETAQALACALPVLACHRAALESSWTWIEQGNYPRVEPLVRHLRLTDSRRHGAPLGSAIDLVCERFYACNEPESLWHLYELLLSHSASAARRASGTFYTPRVIADHLVAHADEQLRQHLNLPAGLADPAVTVLEPACGSGVFLAAAVDHCCRSGASPAEAAEKLLPRLIGIDLSPVPLLLTKLRLAVQLSEHGVTTSASYPQPELTCGNALAGPEHVHALRRPIHAVLGNPPFSYLSRNDQTWIQSLLRGEQGAAGYFQVDGQPLGERKTWLHDDYVKFMRLAQWCIDQSGSGVVAFVTNQGWLDNATFRMMRQQLLRTFPLIDIVDLHGNGKKHEPVPEGLSDENVFGIHQGIALASLTRPADPSTARPGATVCRYASVWGSRAEKLAQLSAPPQNFASQFQRIQPQPPWFQLTPEQAQVPEYYRQAPLLTTVMPVHSTVPVTARDYFVVASTQAELLARLEILIDPQYSDDALRQQFFSRTRSQRYAPGDTRGWKLTAAREALRKEHDLARFIRRCLYRPFVWRFVIWHPAMIDWPRAEFTRHLWASDTSTLPSPQRVLLTRRQSIAGKQCNFFWIADCLPLDGVIRSDNRGSESFFPLWLMGDESRPIRSNFETTFLERVVQRWGPEISPERLLHYCYALFHSPGYRLRHASGLALEFPRVLLPSTSELFDQLADLGGQLVECHLTDPHQVVDPGSVDNAMRQQVEQFQAGTYHVCRKWLSLENASRESPAFAALQQLLARTLTLQHEIDVHIEQAGGYPAAFVSA
jgi:predicted helicase